MRVSGSRWVVRVVRVLVRRVEGIGEVGFMLRVMARIGIFGRVEEIWVLVRGGLEVKSGFSVKVGGWRGKGKCVLW